MTEIETKTLIEWYTTLQCVVRFQGDNSGLIQDIANEIEDCTKKQDVFAGLMQNVPPRVIEATVTAPEYKPESVVMTADVETPVEVKPLPERLAPAKSTPWKDDEVSILRCASSKLQAVEYYHFSEFAGQRTDYAVEQKYDKIKSSCIRVGSRCKIVRETNQYNGHFCTIVKIGESKRVALCRFEGNEMVSFDIADLRVVEK